MTLLYTVLVYNLKAACGGGGCTQRLMRQVKHMMIFNLPQAATFGPGFVFGWSWM